MSPPAPYPAGSRRNSCPASKHARRRPDGSSCKCLRPAAVAENAACLDGAREAGIVVLVTRREAPTAVLRVIRQGRFAKITAAFHQITRTVQPRAKHVFEFVFLAVDLLALRVHHNVA